MLFRIKNLLKLVLFKDQRDRLLEIEKKDKDWRVRQRAKTILLLDEGKTCKEIAEILDIGPRTVGATRKRWLNEQFGSLEDRPRPGSAGKLSESERQQMCQWAKDNALTAKQVLAKHIEAGGVPIHINTVANVLKSQKFVWKRTRHVPKKKPSESEVRQAQVTIEAVRELAQRSELVFGYLDEAGFNQASPNRNAWTPIGTQHSIPAGHGQRLNVIAALMSTGDLEHACLTKSVNADLFVGFLGIIATKRKEKYGDKPIMLFLDNASIHTANKIKEHIEYLKTQKIYLHFLPPYSPHLNRIEKLWHNMKHKWMEFKERTIDQLKEDVMEIINNFGSKYIFGV